MTEREKMINGALYDSSDPELEQLRLNARKLARKYNRTDEDQPEEQAEILRKLLPATKNIREHYQTASIYALSSRFEGFPMVLLEATSMSLPIVAFNCKTGPDEIIKEGENGFLITPNDINGFAEKLLLLMQNETLRQKFGKRSFELSQKFNIQEIGNSWQVLIEKIQPNSKK